MKTVTSEGILVKKASKNLLKLCVILWLFPMVFLSEPPDSLVTLSPIGGILQGASSISIIPAGDIYITERNKHRFLVLNNMGTRIDSVGSQGRNEYRFDRPVSINATNGLRIFVADQNNNRIQMFDRRHQYLTSITSDNMERYNRLNPALLTVSSSNELFVYDPDRFLVHKFDSNGNYRLEFNLRQHRISNLSQIKMAGSTLLLLDIQNGVLHRFQSDGGYLNFIGGFENAKAIYGTDNFIWALFDNRVEKFSHRGASIASFPFKEHLTTAEDLSVLGNTAYILTAEQLYTATVQ